MNVTDSELCVNIAFISSFSIFAGVKSSEDMVAPVNNMSAHVHEKRERVTKTEETQTVVANVQEKEAEHHGAARQGEGDLTVAPGRDVPKPLCHIMSGALQECVKQ